ncbi:hypothetical protein PoB_006711900 [Plakobranchus ocellatus]|uniref:Uncharacterized protein n=1 Tax=Plakobranchus ocellatus TaxID=259542 RepID=A0AAV4D8R8_9GAST|nr:hypothetical protein PoB_006711900 [Plakobranchus ocellatus]
MTDFTLCSGERDIVRKHSNLIKGNSIYGLAYVVSATGPYKLIKGNSIHGLAYVVSATGPYKVSKGNSIHGLLMLYRQLSLTRRSKVTACNRILG